MLVIITIIRQTVGTCISHLIQWIIIIIAPHSPEPLTAHGNYTVDSLIQQIISHNLFHK